MGLDASCAAGALALRGYRQRAIAGPGSGRPEAVGGRRAALSQEFGTPRGLVLLADRGGGAGEHVQGPQEPAVRLVLPRDRAVSLPAGPAQLVEAAMVPGSRVGV